MLPTIVSSSFHRRRIWQWALLAVTVLLIVFAPLPTASAAPAEHTFRIQACRFAFTPERLRVNPGDRVTIELEALDVVHGLSIDGYDFEISADPGQVARISFTANRPGTFRFRCTVTCGNMHPFMIGKLQVGVNELYLRAIGLAILALIAGAASTWK